MMARLGWKSSTQDQKWKVIYDKQEQYYDLISFKK
jgi:hypothetical protein